MIVLILMLLFLDSDSSHVDAFVLGYIVIVLTLMLLFLDSYSSYTDASVLG